MGNLRLLCVSEMAANRSARSVGQHIGSSMPLIAQALVANVCRVQVCEALTAISEAVGPQFVMAELHKRAAANKNPKASRLALRLQSRAN